MGSILYLGVLFFAKMLDNALGTTKTILIQRNKWIFAGISVMLSDFIYFWVTKRIVTAESNLVILVVALAGGIGCALACLVSDKLSKDRTYVNVIMSDDLKAMKAFGIFLQSITSQMWLPIPIRSTGTERRFPLRRTQKQKPKTV